MPIKLINRQRVMSRVGKIRIGEQKKSARTGGFYPAYRETFLFTTPNKAALEMLQKHYGGELAPWKEEAGLWALDTDVNTIQVMLDVNQSGDETFSLYDGQTPARRCDGCTCHHIEVQRNDPKDKKKVTGVIDHGDVPCLCDPDELGDELPDEDRKCNLRTSLRVVIPATADVTLWELTSIGKTFNKETFGLFEMLQETGLKQAFCLLTIHIVESTIGNEKKKFAVPRLTLDPNPPNFVRMLMERTPAAQVRELTAAMDRAPALTPSNNAGALPQRNGHAKAVDDVIDTEGREVQEPKADTKTAAPSGPVNQPAYELAAEFNIDGKARDTLARWPDVPGEDEFRSAMDEIQRGLDGKKTINLLILEKKPASWKAFVESCAPQGAGLSL